MFLLLSCQILINCAKVLEQRPNESEVKVKPVPGVTDVAQRRWCCKLMPESSFINLPDLNLPHHTNNEELGLIYTSSLGFFDIAHARSHIDWFFSIYENIRNNSSNFDFVGDAEVHVSLTSIPSDPVTKANLARYILFYYSKFYEYATFDAKTGPSKIWCPVVI